MVEAALDAANGAMVDTRRFWTDGDKAAVRAMLNAAYPLIASLAEDGTREEHRLNGHLERIDADLDRLGVPRIELVDGTEVVLSRRIRIRWLATNRKP